MNRLAIIDWGIGGISIHKLIKKQLGEIPIIYFSDTGATPYGKMTRAELVSRLNAVIEFLKSQGTTHIAIGCNAASTAIPYLSDHGIAIEGVIESAVNVTINMKPKRLGLIGGRRTVLSGVFRRAFANYGLKVAQRIAQPLSGLIESGDVSSDVLRAECERILTPLKNCSHILLACTHYAAIIPVMRDFVSDETVFVDPAPSLVSAVKSWHLPARGDDSYLTTGDARSMKMSALSAFGWKIDSVKNIRL